MERLHTAENRALSQTGIISSKQVHDKEINDLGVHDMEKFYDNMKAAQKEAANRIHGTPYSSDTIDSFIAPLSSDWVFSAEYETQIKTFIQHDSDSYHVENNFLIKPAGVIWEKLCQKYSLFKEKAKSAFHINAHISDPCSAFATHYSFTNYRSDEEWSGEPVTRYEIQPITDVAHLPDFHYLSYKDTLQTTEALKFELGDVPNWAQTPDFFLPSRNIKYLLEKDPDLIESNIETVSNLLGVSAGSILDYVASLNEKERVKAERTKLVEKFKDTPLGLLQMKELKYLLNTHFNVPVHSGRVKKADFLTAIQTETVRRNLSEKDLGGLVKELFPNL